MTQLNQWISNKSSKLLVFTGAGSSADSGISTFRDNNGLWENHDVDIVANGYTWKNHFDQVHQFYNTRRQELSLVKPNAIHYKIAQWQQKYNTLIITQNIDDLLERAGCTDVIHLHGNLTVMKCVACGKTWDIGYTQWDTNNRCSCGSKKGVRPNVVFFNEDAPEYIKMYKAFSNIVESNDCIVVIGTSGQVIAIDQLINPKPYKILNNLESSKYINESLYNSVLFGKASELHNEIDSLISQHMIGIA